MNEEIVSYLDSLVKEYINFITTKGYDKISSKEKFRIFIEIFKILTEWTYTEDSLIKTLISKNIIRDTYDKKKLVKDNITFLKEKNIIKSSFKPEQKSNKINILHLSDLQMGRDIDQILLKKLIIILSELKAELLDYVIITGDLTSSGEENEFKRFKLFLVNLNIIFPYIEKENIIIIPGNHDLDRKLSKIDKSWKFINYEKFIKGFYGIKKKNYFVTVKKFNKYQLPIICLDSNSLITHQPSTFSRAYITDDQVIEILDYIKKRNKMEKITQNDFLKIYCIHHPPQLLENFYGGTIDKLFIGNGLHIILHGHTHTFETPTILYTRKNKAIMSIGCGSPTIKPQLRLKETYSKAQFNLITITDNTKEREILNYDINIKSYILENFFEKKQINEYNFNCELGSNVIVKFSMS